MPITPINETTYEATLTGGDKVEIGDREAVVFKPHLKLNRWGGECFIAIQPQGEIEEEAEVEVEGDKIKYKYKVKQDGFELEMESEFYALGTNAQRELGGFEFEIILNKKPVDNKIVLNIETQGLRFSYQPELTDESRGKTSPEQKFNDEVLPLIISMNPGSVLDLGGGRGELVRDLNASGIPATVFEVSQEAYDNRVTDNFILGDTTQTPWSFSDKEFDCITGVGFLKYINEADINNLIEEIVRTSNRAVFFLGHGSYQPSDSPPIVEMRSKEWWANRFASVSPAYNVEFFDLVIEKVFRPDNVVGSYAVYHATRTKWHASPEEAEKYKTCKMGHFYYPYLVDAEGWKVRAEDFKIDTEKGLLTITLPQQFLDEATYPVTIDPEFGYTTHGLSSLEIAAGPGAGSFQSRAGSAWTMPAPGGTANYIRADLKVSSSGTNDCKVFINQKDSGGAGTHGQIATKENLGCGDGWEEFTLAGETLTQGVVYILNIAVSREDMGSYELIILRYDVDAAVASYMEEQVYVTPESPWVVDPEGTTRDYSIYCNYSAAAPPAGLENKSANMAAKMVAAGLI